MRAEIPETAATPLEGQLDSSEFANTAKSSRRASVRVCFAIEL